MLAPMQGPPPAPSDVRLRLALDAAELGTWYWDVESGVTVWDRQMRRIFGVGPDWPGTYDAWVATLHPLDRDAVVATVRSEYTRDRVPGHPEQARRPDSDIPSL